jgi:hypothetical protein
MANAMKGVTKALTKMNKQTSLPGLQKIMADFARENEKSEIVQEAIGDTLDDAMEEDGAAEEEDMIVSQVVFSSFHLDQSRSWTNWGLVESTVFPMPPFAGRRSPKQQRKKKENVRVPLLNLPCSLRFSGSTRCDSEWSGFR